MGSSASSPRSAWRSGARIPRDPLTRARRLRGRHSWCRAQCNRPGRRPQGWHARPLALRWSYSFPSRPGLSLRAESQRSRTLASAAPSRPPSWTGALTPCLFPQLWVIRSRLKSRTTDPPGNTSYTCVVRESDPPVVVRTSPPPHKRDVPLNASIIVVFSTPIDEASLTGASVELRHGSTVVDGRLEFADDNHIAVVLIPNGALAPLTDYEVVVTGGIHDQSGDALQGPVTTQFTTGASSFPTALLRVRKAPLPNGDGQIGAAGTPLPLPLRVIVDSAQIPRAGVEVTWSAAAGTIEPLTSLTDSAGIAVASWTLDMIAGVATATATIAENPGLPANFSATARAGTVTRICCGVIPLAPMMMDGTYYPSRGVFPTDQFSNVVKGERLTWQVVSGPISVVVINVTPDQYGVSYMRLSPTGFEGVGVVRAALASAPASVYLDLSVSVRANGAVAYIEYVPHPTASFQTWAHSGHNGSVDPAVDTIAAGQTMVWALQDYDYDIHRITTSGGSLSLSTGDWAYGQMQDSVTLSTPGTYQYTDAYHATFKGTVVVK